MTHALVTGGGGFLGEAIVRRLLASNHQVRSLSRSRYPALDALGVEQHQGDAGDLEVVLRAVEGVDVVFHVAGKAGAWGPWEDYHRANVLSAQHLITACHTHGVRDLVHTSSPSVVFNGQDLEGADESLPYPNHWEAHYPRSKALGEQAILAAHGQRGLATVSLRPHLIWGPGDTNLVPRIVKRGRAGQLVRIGRTPKLIDTVYIDDAADAHLLAFERLRDPATRPNVGGKTYFITSGQPVEVWTMVNRILAAAHLPPVKHTLPRPVAQAAAWGVEAAWRLLKRQDEPRLTRWIVQELASSHWFDITAARRELGYDPKISLDEGMKRLEAWLNTHPIA